MPPPPLHEQLDAARDSSALNLPYNSIGDDGCNAIARYIRENVMLKTVDLRGNSIRGDGLVVLAHALRSADSVTSLCMKWNQLGIHERGIQALCDVLKRNETLLHLDLRNNKFGPACGRHLGQMLRENATLTHIDVSWNDLGSEGGQLLLGGIEENRTLIECQLGGNKIDEETMKGISAALRRNRQLAPLSAALVSETYRDGEEPFPPSPSSPSRMLHESLPPTTARDLDFSIKTASAGYQTQTGTAPLAKSQQVDPNRPPIDNQDDTLMQRLLIREQSSSKGEDARFFGEVAEYIDLLELDVARNKRYRLEAEDKERVVTRGIKEREQVYAQERKELENLLASAQSEKDELLHEAKEVQAQIDQVHKENEKLLDERAQMEDKFKLQHSTLFTNVAMETKTKAELETSIYMVKRTQLEQEQENARLRAYLSKCMDDLDKALQ